MDATTDPMTGEWNNFNFRSIQEIDFPAVLEHLRDSFYKDEPTQIIGGTSDDRRTDLDNRILLFLEENMSFMAICKSTHKIAAIIIMTHESVDKMPKTLIPLSPLTVTIRSCLGQLENSVNIFEDFGVQQYGNIFIVSVHQDFRGRGLATEMFRRAVEFLRTLNYSLIECTFSNPLSRRIGEKFGFVELKRMYYSEAKDKATGSLLFPNAPPDKFVNITVLNLQNK